MHQRKRNDITYNVYTERTINTVRAWVAVGTSDGLGDMQEV